MRFLLRERWSRFFGTDAEADETALGNPARIDIDVDYARNLYVFDGQRSRIVAFAPAGH